MAWLSRVKIVGKEIGKEDNMGQRLKF